ncbi:M12 family metallo-peptidase [Paenibacillus sp. GCM10027629]|uniref:M12 family metallo-peptidase n=1 Tax=Paenibacillus sp. GCM10027629 TaxID=3273414 RepID=UPI00362BC55E
MTVKKYLAIALTATLLLLPSVGIKAKSIEASDILETAATPINYAEIGKPASQLVDYEVERDSVAKIFSDEGKVIGEKRTLKNRGDNKEKALRSEGRLVKVLAVADEEYREAHSDWINRVQRIIESADDIYNSNFSIDFEIDGYGPWNSIGSNSSALLSNLASQGYKGYDLVIGFTANPNFTDGGLAYVYTSDPVTGYSLNVDQDEGSTAKVVRHEVGHNYGIKDHQDSIICINNDNYTYTATNWDTTHKNLIASHKTWFGAAVGL